MPGPWWEAIPGKKANVSTTPSVDKVLGQHQIKRQTFFYVFASRYAMPPCASYDSRNKKTFIVNIDADSDFECRELYITIYPKTRFTLLFWNEFNTGNPVDLFSFETRTVAGPNEPIDLSYPFPSSSHAELIIESDNEFHTNYFDAWLKGFKVFK